MVIYLEHTIGLMFQRASQIGEEAFIKIQKLVESGIIKETKDGYKYLVIEDKEEQLNDKEDESI